MREEKKLFKLSLQFFGEDDNDFLDDVDTDDPDDTDGDFDNADGDFNEEFFDGDGDLDDGADGDADGDADDEADGDVDDGADSDADDGADGEADNVAQSANDDAQSANGDLISELRALGYVGNDLAALTADMKAKREAKAAQEAKAQAKADRVDGKSHVRSSVPGKSASGDGTGGVSERRVISVAENAKISREEARRMLAKHARLIEGK